MKICKVCKGAVKEKQILGKSLVYRCESCDIEYIVRCVDIADIREDDEDSLNYDNEEIKITSKYSVLSDTIQKKESALRWIVANSQYLKINGMLVDSFSASVVVKCLDNLSQEQKGKLLELSIEKIVSFCFKLLERVQLKSFVSC